MEHKHAEVLRAIADGKAVDWKQSDFNWNTCNNVHVFNPLNHSELEWRIKPEPVIEICYFVKQDFPKGLNYQEVHISNKWDLKITYQDGKAVKAELKDSAVCG